MFGELMRGHRVRRGLTQEDLAARSGVSARHIRDLEAGRTTRPRASTARLIADALGLDGVDLERFLEAALAGAAAPPASPPDAYIGGGAAGYPGASAGPCLLPPDPARFVGRIRAIETAQARLLAPGDPPETLVVTGPAGIGKTCFVVRLAHLVAKQFPDGQLYVNLQGFGPAGSAMSPVEALRGFLDALQVPSGHVPATAAAMTMLYRRLLAGRRVLVVLDNARDAEQVRPLLPGAPGCAVVVTSRSQLPGLVAVEGAHLVTLDPLPAAEARELLSCRVGAQRVAAEQPAVDDIIECCGQLPLALAIVAARAATHPAFPLRALASELRAAGGSLDAFVSPDPAIDIRAVLSSSYRCLSPSAARLFRLLASHPGPDMSAAAAASLAAIARPQARLLLSELTCAHLVTEHMPGRYALHDLLRAYASELTKAADPEDEQRATLHRALDHYLHTAHAANQRLGPLRYPIDPAPPRPGVTVEQPADCDLAMAWFNNEHAVLLSCVAVAVGSGFDRQAGQLACVIADFLDRRGLWYDLVASQEAALAAARRLGDLTGQANSRRILAWALGRLGRGDEARAHLRTAFEQFGEVSDHLSQAHTLLSLSWLCEQDGDHRQALRHDLDALDLYRAGGHRAGEASALNAIGWHHGQLGDYHLALVHCEQALTLHQELGNRPGQACTWDSVGYALDRLGDRERAITCFQQALKLLREVGHRHVEGLCLAHLGDVYSKLGRLTDAGNAWRSALDILELLNHSDADLVREKLHAIETPAVR